MSFFCGISPFWKRLMARWMAMALIVAMSAARKRWERFDMSPRVKMAAMPATISMMINSYW